MFNNNKDLSQRIKKIKNYACSKIRIKIIVNEDKLLYNLKWKTLVKKKPEY